MDSAYEPARTLLARALAENGRYAEALQQLDRVQQPPSSAVLSFIAYVDAKSGNVAAARQTLGALRRQVGQNYFSPYYLALVYIALGDRETALTHLERSFSEQESTLVNVNVDPRFEPIRDDPRFVALVERLHFPPSQKRGGVK